jgi:hypothetical protein
MKSRWRHHDVLTISNLGFIDRTRRIDAASFVVVERI